MKYRMCHKTTHLSVTNERVRNAVSFPVEVMIDNGQYVHIVRGKQHFSCFLLCSGRVF